MSSNLYIRVYPLECNPVDGNPYIKSSSHIFLGYTSFSIAPTAKPAKSKSNAPLYVKGISAVSPPNRLHFAI